MPVNYYKFLMVIIFISTLFDCRRLALNLRDVSVHFNKPPPEGAMVQPMVLLTVKGEMKI